MGRQGQEEKSKSSRPFLLVFKTFLDSPRSSLPRAPWQRSSCWGVRARWVCGNRLGGSCVLPVSRIPKEKNSRIFCLSKSSTQESPSLCSPGSPLPPALSRWHRFQVTEEKQVPSGSSNCGALLRGAKSPRIPIRRGFY